MNSRPQLMALVSIRALCVSVFCVRVCVCQFIWFNVFVSVCVCVCVYMYMCVCVCVFTCVCVCRPSLFMNMANVAVKTLKLM